MVRQGTIPLFTQLSIVRVGVGNIHASHCGSGQKKNPPPVKEAGFEN